MISCPTPSQLLCWWVNMWWLCCCAAALLLSQEIRLSAAKSPNILFILSGYSLTNSLPTQLSLSLLSLSLKMIWVMETWRCTPTHSVHMAGSPLPTSNVRPTLGGVSCLLSLSLSFFTALASQGMTFTEAYAGAPVCAPSRCALVGLIHQ